ncbi:radical SAM protein [bacterium]|nr:radical SAM protein [bacterium]
MLKVNEIFHSIQGESTHTGRPCVFIRLTGCNLRCHYCDTPYAYEAGRTYQIETLLKKINDYECRLVEITGGEPLLQKETPKLCRLLTEQGFEVLVETNGSKNINCLPAPVKRILDVKCPGSGEADKMDEKNYHRLRYGDEVKFVLADIADYRWAKSMISQRLIPDFVPILFSPVFSKLEPKILAAWILHDRLNVRLHLQLQKIIWPESEQGR